MGQIQVNGRRVRLLGLVDPKRIAVYGCSAGAHLPASAATLDDAPPAAQLSAAPNALVLVSLAVSVTSSPSSRHD